MQVALSTNAKREYEKFSKQERAKIKKKLLSLERNPLSGKKLKGELVGYYSIRVWPYKIIYEVNKKENMIQVHKIRHRQGAYK